MDPSAWEGYVSIKMLYESALFGRTLQGPGLLAHLEKPGTVIDTSDHSVIRTVQLGLDSRPVEMALSPDGKTLYVAGGGTSSVYVIDTAGYEVTKVIHERMGQRPWGIAITPDGDKVFTANGLSDSVSVISTECMCVVDEIATGRGSRSAAIGVVPPDKRGPEHENAVIVRSDRCCCNLHSGTGPVKRKTKRFYRICRAAALCHRQPCLGPAPAGAHRCATWRTRRRQQWGGSGGRRAADTVAGDVVREVREVRARIGMVFQEPALDDRLSARENLKIPAALYGTPWAKVRPEIDDAPAWASLSDMARRPVRSFSGGMKRRLELCRALMPWRRATTICQFLGCAIPATTVRPGVSSIFA